MRCCAAIQISSAACRSVAANWAARTVATGDDAWHRPDHLTEVSPTGCPDAGNRRLWGPARERNVDD